MSRFVVHTVGDEFWPVVAFYDRVGAKIDDPAQAYSFDAHDGKEIQHYEIPFPPNPSGFWPVQ